MAPVSSRASQIVGPLSYVLDYIGSPLLFALFVSWLRNACQFGVVLSTFCWVVVAVMLFQSVMNFVPAGIQAYRNSLGYGRERRLRVWAVTTFAALSYVYSFGGVLAPHAVLVGAIAVVVNTVLTTMLCAITHSTPRWSLRRH